MDNISNGQEFKSHSFFTQNFLELAWKRRHEESPNDKSPFLVSAFKAAGLWSDQIIED